jgi:hypothetical protein
MLVKEKPVRAAFSQIPMYRTSISEVLPSFVFSEKCMETVVHAA